MTVGERVCAALESFPYPVQADKFSPENEETTEYFVYTYDTGGAVYGDNEPGEEIVHVTLHFFCPDTFALEGLSRRVKRAMTKAGFTYPSYESAFDETGRHAVWECETIEGSALYGEV